jgi:SET domain-containing protein
MRSQWSFCAILFILIIILSIFGSLYSTHEPYAEKSKAPESCPAPAVPNDDTFHDSTVTSCNMCTSFTNDNVYVKKSKYKGRGVYASRKIYMGEEIEACPILLELKDRIPANNVLTDYVFSTGIEGEVAFAMGYCGLFNHDDNNNARWFIDRDTRTVTIIALKDIKKDEEIFVSYGDKYWATRNIKKD